MSLTRVRTPFGKPWLSTKGWIRRLTPHQEIKVAIPCSSGVRRALDAAGDNEIVVYDGVPHSFFDRTSTDNEAAADDAWTWMLRFMN